MNDGFGGRDRSLPPLGRSTQLMPECDIVCGSCLPGIIRDGCRPPPLPNIRTFSWICKFRRLHPRPRLATSMASNVSRHHLSVFYFFFFCHPGWRPSPRQGAEAGEVRAQRRIHHLSDPEGRRAPAAFVHCSSDARSTSDFGLHSGAGDQRALRNCMSTPDRGVDNRDKTASPDTRSLCCLCSGVRRQMPAAGKPLPIAGVDALRNPRTRCHFASKTGRSRDVRSSSARKLSDNWVSKLTRGVVISCDPVSPRRWRPSCSTPIARKDNPPGGVAGKSRPYHRSGVVLAVRSDSQASSLASLVSVAVRGARSARGLHDAGSRA